MASAIAHCTEQSVTTLAVQLAQPTIRRKI